VFTYILIIILAVIAYEAHTSGHTVRFVLASALAFILILNRWYVFAHTLLPEIVHSTTTLLVIAAGVVGCVVWRYHRHRANVEDDNETVETVDPIQTNGSTCFSGRSHSNRTWTPQVRGRSRQH
jgi:high-affinity Fe2+/Pb2+ permease